MDHPLHEDRFFRSCPPSFFSVSLCGNEQTPSPVAQSKRLKSLAPHRKSAWDNLPQPVTTYHSVPRRGVSTVSQKEGRVESHDRSEKASRSFFPPQNSSLHCPSSTHSSHNSASYLPREELSPARTPRTFIPAVFQLCLPLTTVEEPWSLTRKESCTSVFRADRAQRAAGTLMAKAAAVLL